MAIKVLVTGAGGDVGQGVLKSLSQSSLNLELYTLCISDRSSWLHRVAHSFIAPLSASEEYIPFLIRLINKYAINVLFPTVDSEISKIANGKRLIESETGCLVFVDKEELVSIADDKLKTADFLKANGFCYPHSISLSSSDLESFLLEHGFPLILKSRRGRGSQEVFTVNSMADLEPYVGNDGFMLQQWLDPSQGEYTSGFYLGDDGQVKGTCTFRRQLKNGSTYIAERIIEPTLEKPLEEMATTLGMKYLNIQSMRSNDRLIPFEFNGRLSGTTAIVSRVFNAPEMFIRERLLGEVLARIENSSRFVAMRYNEEVYATMEEIKDLHSRSQCL